MKPCQATRELLGLTEIPTADYLDVIGVDREDRPDTAGYGVAMTPENLSILLREDTP